MVISSACSRLEIFWFSSYCGKSTLCIWLPSGNGKLLMTSLLPDGNAVTASAMRVDSKSKSGMSARKDLVRQMTANSRIFQGHSSFDRRFEHEREKEER